MVTTKIENLSATKKKLNITVPKDTVTEYFNKACQKVGQTAKVSGFRPGKIPQNILEKHYGAEINYECLNAVIADTYSKSLADHRLTPMTEPHFHAHPPAKNADYSYSVEVEIKPQFELRPYKGLKIKKHEVTVSDAEVGEELKRLQNSLAQLAPAADDAVLGNGLVGTIDFDGRIDDKPFEGGSAKDYVFECGAAQLLKEFEDKMAGMKKGDVRAIDITFPADYFEKKIAGKKAGYEITLKNLHVKSLPALDDEMAKDIGKENLEQVKKELRESLVKRKERGHYQDYVAEARTQLVKQHKFDVPESIVTAEMERTKRGKDEVTDQIKLELILEEIAGKENIRATPQDIEQRLAVLSQMYRQPLAEIKKLYNNNRMMGALAVQVTFDKTLDFIVKNAEMV